MNRLQPRLLICLLLLPALAVACQARPAGRAEPAAPRRLGELSYGTDPAQRLDVWLPADAREAPIIVMVHGGAWRIGDKRHRAVVENKRKRWLPRGFALVSVNYRLLPQATPLQQAEDVARALAYIQREAASWGADAGRIVLMGHSAGAHLVSLLSADPALAQRRGARRWLGSVALDSAAFDLVPIMQGEHYRFYDRAFGSDPADWRAVSPLHRLTPRAVPLLAVCSTERADGSCAQAQAYADKARGLGVPVSVSPQPMSHRQINEALGLDNAETEAVEAFMAALDPVIAHRLRR